MSTTNRASEKLKEDYMLPKRNLEYLKNRNTAPQRMNEIVFDSPKLTVRKIMHWDDAQLYRSFFADYFKLFLYGKRDIGHNKN